MTKKTNFVRENRLGRFKISQELIYDRAEDVLEVMQKFIIVRCESLFFDQSLEYIAYSPLFRKIDHGEKIPVYLIEVSKNKKNEIKVIAKEIDKV